MPQIVAATEGFGAVGGRYFGALVVLFSLGFAERRTFAGTFAGAAVFLAGRGRCFGLEDFATALFAVAAASLRAVLALIRASVAVVWSGSPRSS